LPAGRHGAALLRLAVEDADLAEVAILFERSGGVVRVARADETEVVRIEALRLLELQPGLQRIAHVAASETS
jgi:hypothetical protein